jgi:putative flippase GtrA
MPEGPSTALGRLRAYSKTPECGKVFRYVTVSGISTVLSLVMLYLFYRRVGLSPAWANVVATCIATVPSYFLNRTWVWGKNGKSHFKTEVLPFWIIAVISLGLSTAAVKLAAHEADLHFHSDLLKTGFILFANFFTYGVMWIGKFLLFNKILFVHRGEDGKIEPVVLVPAE